MKADLIIKNAKIFTSDKDKSLAAALVVKDGNQEKCSEVAFSEQRDLMQPSHRRPRGRLLCLYGR